MKKIGKAILFVLIASLVLFISYKLFYYYYAMNIYNKVIANTENDYEATVTIVDNDNNSYSEMNYLKNENYVKVQRNDNGVKSNETFHTEKLKDASQKLKDYVDNKKFKQGNIEVLKNIDATPYCKDDDFKEVLSAHMVSPVRMDKIIDRLNSENVELYVEVGPGHTLSGFVKKQLKNANVINIDSVEAIEKLVNLVKEN